MVFAAEASWKGRLDAARLRGGPGRPRAAARGRRADQDAGQFWKDFIRETAPEFRKPTIEQLETLVEPVWQALIDGARYCEPQLAEIIDRAGPDVIVEDNVIAFPALLTAGVPFVRIMSCNPLEMKDAGDLAAGVLRLPGRRPQRVGRRSAPSTSGPTGRLWEGFNAWVRRAGRAAAARPRVHPRVARPEPVRLPRGRRLHRRRPLGADLARLESSVRETDGAFELPGRARATATGALVYLRSARSGRPTSS